ncbi:hypothetical protein [Pseudomonas paeninsulae]|uniref:hypothetical protein n=1 Tax=Pseudomonas paeninsulae TaxID=3110772 RepID=UPI002D7862D6|nr:hypothetical protein [Pseudomonas sp. IT1137]
MSKTPPRGLYSIAAIIALIALIAIITAIAMVTLVAMATIIAIVTMNLADRHGHVANLSWCVAIAMMPVVAWCVMHYPLRLAVIMALSIVMRIIERRNQQRADCNAGDYGNDLASLESGSTACRHKTTGQ